MSTKTTILGGKAFNRSIFVEGAIKASIFLSQSQPGKFTMKDVINSVTT